MSNNFEKFGTVINDDPANKALDWDAEIEASESEFRLLEKGQYDFTVAKFERANFDGSAKVPPCPLARLTLTVHDSQGDVQVFNNLFLTEKTAWQPFMTDHCSRQSSGGLLQNIRQCYLTEIMNPQIRLLTTSYIQSCLRLHILPPQIHMSFHHPAVSRFQISITDKINQLTCYFFLIHS